MWDSALYLLRGLTDAQRMLQSDFIEYLKVFGVPVHQHLNVEALLSLSSAGDDLTLGGRRHLRPQLQQSFTESLETQQRAERCQIT